MSVVAFSFLDAISIQLLDFVSLLMDSIPSHCTGLIVTCDLMAQEFNKVAKKYPSIKVTFHTLAAGILIACYQEKYGKQSRRLK